MGSLEQRLAPAKDDGNILTKKQLVVTVAGRDTPTAGAGPKLKRESKRPLAAIGRMDRRR